MRRRVTVHTGGTNFSCFYLLSIIFGLSCLPALRERFRYSTHIYTYVPYIHYRNTIYPSIYMVPPGFHPHFPPLQFRVRRTYTSSKYIIHAQNAMSFIARRSFFAPPSTAAAASTAASTSSSSAAAAAARIPSSSSAGPALAASARPFSTTIPNTQQQQQQQQQRGPVELGKDALKRVDRAVSNVALKGFEKGGTFVSRSPQQSNSLCWPRFMGGWGWISSKTFS